MHTRRTGLAVLCAHPGIPDPGKPEPCFGKSSSKPYAGRSAAPVALIGGKVFAHSERLGMVASSWLGAGVAWRVGLQALNSSSPIAHRIARFMLALILA
jgi:hypothetical protein